MNCCDYNCTQGRDCPARKPAAAVTPKAEDEDQTIYVFEWIAKVMARAIIFIFVFVTVTLGMYQLLNIFFTK
jgi:hypothetical protein